MVRQQHGSLAAKAAPRLCPHCLGELTGHDHATGGRCASCRLHVGAARSTTSADNATNGRRAGGAAALGVRADRLRMLDYQGAWVGDQRLCSLGSVLACFESWTAARRAAHAGA